MTYPFIWVSTDTLVLVKVARKPPVKSLVLYQNPLAPPFRPQNRGLVFYFPRRPPAPRFGKRPDFFRIFSRQPSLRYNGTILRVDLMQLDLQFDMFPKEAVIGVARDMDKRYNLSVMKHGLGK